MTQVALHAMCLKAPKNIEKQFKASNLGIIIPSQKGKIYPFEAPWHRRCRRIWKTLQELCLATGTRSKSKKSKRINSSGSTVAILWFGINPPKCRVCLRLVQCKSAPLPHLPPTGRSDVFCLFPSIPSSFGTCA